jgi:RNA polymerase sigma factor (TIGR02999 family)
VPRLTTSTGRGTRAASDALFASLYGKLHRMAQRELARHGESQTLGATTLLHEAYLAIADREPNFFPDRKAFTVYVSHVMRGLIIDHTRRRQAQKRGGEFHFVPITDVVDTRPDHRAFIAVRDAVDGLAKVDPRLALIVDLKFFFGFSFSEIAATQGISERTVQRGWEKARIYLRTYFATAPPDSSAVSAQRGRRRPSF